MPCHTPGYTCNTLPGPAPEPAPPPGAACHAHTHTHLHLAPTPPPPPPLARADNLQALLQDAPLPYSGAQGRASAAAAPDVMAGPSRSAAMPRDHA